MKQRHPQTVVLLAAGRGSRLRPHTNTTPKPLLPINGRPTLDYVLTAVSQANIPRVCLITHYLEEQIQAFVGQGAQWGVEVAFVHQSQMLGTGHAVQTAVSALPSWFSDSFMVAATDYILPATFLTELVQKHYSHQEAITISLREVLPEEQAKRSSVRFTGDFLISEVVEKPPVGQAPSPYSANLIYILPPAILPHLAVVQPSPRGEVELQTAVNALLASGVRAKGLRQRPLSEWHPLHSA